jgi:hypothetical protein
LQSGQGSSVCSWDAAETVDLDQAPGTGQSRNDLIICLVRDAGFDGGGNNDFIFAKVTGTPAASNPPVPATPPNALVMARVTVPGQAADLSTATINDVRPLGLAVPPNPLPGQILAYKQVAMANYITTSGSFVFVNNANARVGPFVVPPSGRVLLSAGSLWTSAGGGIGSVAFSDVGSASAYVCAGQQIATSSTALMNSIIQSVSYPLVPGAVRTLALVWAVTKVAGTIGLGSGSADLTLIVSALP